MLEQTRLGASMKPYRYFGIECAQGWKDLVQPLFELCDKHDVEVLQVKEKFGGLRFYVGGAPDEVYDAIRKAEDLSLTICMICGAPGKPRGGGWILTLCDNHYKEEVDAGRRNPTLSRSEPKP